MSPRRGRADARVQRWGEDSWSKSWRPTHYSMRAARLAIGHNLLIRRFSCAASLVGRARRHENAAAMAVFDKSLKVPMGTLGVGSTATSSFATTSAQRAPVRLSTRAGPGQYDPKLDTFARFEGPPAMPSKRQPLRMLPTSPQLAKSTVRYASAGPQFEPPYTRDALNFPGPGRYNLERYSQFSPLAFAARNQPFAAMVTGRSSIRDVYPDARCGIACRTQTTPSPLHYSPVTPLDRLRLSMPNPPSPGRIRATRGMTLDTALRSPSNLSSTLRDMVPAQRRLLTPL